MLKEYIINNFDFLILSFFLFFLICFSFSNKKIKMKKSKKNILGYKIFYSDNKNSKNKGILKSEKYLLRGKPDFIYKHILFNKYIVVELKSGNSDYIKENDLMQLVAYFLIIEDLYKKPKEGRLIYNDNMFIIKNKKKLRKKLLNTMEEMDTMLETGTGYANCSFASCKHCLAKFVCEIGDKNA